MDRHTALEIVRTTLAADCACKPSDWLSDEVILVEAREVAGRRRFPMRVKPFSMTTMGHGVVISCSTDRLGWAEENLRQQRRDELFSVSTLSLIAGFVAPDRQVLVGPFPNYVCAGDAFCAAKVPSGFTLQLFEQEQMAEVYRFEGFSHALSYRMDHPSLDMIAVAAWHKGQVVGMAGVGGDSDHLWQIGVDVAPQCQGMGLGKALVSRATEATLEHGKTPYYAHHISNIRSGNTALSVGYQLAWTATYVRDL